MIIQDEKNFLSAIYRILVIFISMAKSWNCRDMDSMGEARRQLRITYLNDHNSIFEGSPDEMFDSLLLRDEYPGMLTSKLDMPMQAFHDIDNL